MSVRVCVWCLRALAVPLFLAECSKVCIEIAAHIDNFQNPAHACAFCLRVCNSGRVCIWRVSVVVLNEYVKVKVPLEHARRSFAIQLCIWTIHYYVQTQQLHEGVPITIRNNAEKTPSSCTKNTCNEMAGCVMGCEVRKKFLRIFEHVIMLRKKKGYAWTCFFLFWVVFVFCAIFEISMKF